MANGVPVPPRDYAPRAAGLGPPPVGSGSSWALDTADSAGHDAWLMTATALAGRVKMAKAHASRTLVHEFKGAPGRPGLLALPRLPAG